MRRAAVRLWPLDNAFHSHLHHPELRAGHQAIIVLK